MSVLIDGLPDAVAVRCLAHVPFYLHPKLELVSRSWRAALRSPELFKAREEVGSTEEFLCVCAFEPENLWQLYDPVHDIWVTIPIHPSKIRHLAHFGAVSACGKLFVLGGGSEAVDPLTGDQDGSFATNEVWSYDPVMRKWAQCAPMAVPRAMFACCVLDGKIIVAGGFTSCRKSIAQAEIYDPEKDIWVSIPDLPYTHNSACSGVVVGGKMHVVHKGLSMVQVLVNLPSDGWVVEDYGWLQGPMAVVKGVLYVMSHGLIYRQERERRKVVVSASEVRKRIGSAMVGLGGEIYVVGGVIGPDRCNRDIKPTSDVDVLTVGSERPVWRRVAPMSRCRGTVLGCTRGNCSVSLTDDSKELLHRDSIRAVRFSRKGKLLVSAGDDKLVKIWSTETWKCLSTVNSEKRVSAVAISKDELHICFADKFGVVWVVDLVGLIENQDVFNKKAVAILGHYCSIITSLEFSPDGQYIVSADRDFKIRVGVFPKDPLNGVHEIQSFCLGHSEFVSCLTFVHNSEFPNSFLVSGSGDSTVCLWDITSGSLLCTSDVGREEGLSEECHPAVTDLCATPDGSLVAVAIQSLQGILLLSCDLSTGALSTLKVVSIPGETFIPTRLGMSSSGDLLWMVTGASNLPGSEVASVARVRMMSSFKKRTSDGSDELRVLDDEEIPGGEQLLEKLQGRASVESTMFSATADVINAAMSNLLRKKQYSDEKREFKKRTRNDKKFRR